MAQQARQQAWTYQDFSVDRELTNPNKSGVTPGTRAMCPTNLLGHCDLFRPEICEVIAEAF
jgi:hypothetical protein